MVRELYEETGLHVDEVLGELQEMRWESKREGGKQSMQVNYVVSVREGNGDGGVSVVLNPEEHEEWMWAGWEEVTVGLEMSEEMRKVVRDGLEFFEERMMGVDEGLGKK